MYCSNCGKQLPDGAKFCTFCGAQQAQSAAGPQPQPEAQSTAYSRPQPQQAAQPAGTTHAAQPAAQKRENVPLGILGALLGSLAGVVVMVILDRLGVIAALSGIIMLGGAVWGYAHFGKVLSTKSIIICVPIVIAMVYLGSRLCWAITVQGLYPAAGKPNLLDMFVRLPAQLEAAGLEDSFYDYLSRQYAFAVVGIVLLIINVVRGNRAAKKNKS